MDVEFHYERTVRIPLKSQYDYVLYRHGKSVKYSSDEIEELSIIDTEEFKELEKSIDKVQRKCIMNETGIEELPMDGMVTRKFKLRRRDK